VRLGGLFSGIGGFELAWQRLGGEVAWMCEVDKAARRVLEERFPGVPIYEDVRDLDPSEVPPVDVLTGGSPCQGFSVAGRRTGLDHGESVLFADYVRILDGLADRGLRWAVWENVPGVLSIKNPDGERTFPHVVAALLGADQPVRLDPARRWNVGLGIRGGRSASWRVLDSRYFGVAQRRRRVFACVAVGDPDGRRAVRALLAESTGLPWHSAASVAPGQAPPAGSGGGADGEGRGRAGGGWGVGVDLVSHTLTTRAAGGAIEDGTGRGAPIVTDLPDELDQHRPLHTGPLTTHMSSPRGSETTDSHHVVVDVPRAFRKSRRAQTADEPESWVEDGSANTLNLFDAGDARTTHAVVQPIGAHETGFGWWNAAEWAGTVRAEGGNNDANATNLVLEPQTFVIEPETGQGADLRARASSTSPALTQTNAPDRVVHVVEAIPIQDAERGDKSQNGVGIGAPGDPSYTLDTASTHAVAVPNGEEVATARPRYGVRRLTPLECERLQAFPDRWTEPAGSDSARYKALGNAVTVNTVGWILGRIMAVEATPDA